MSIHCVLYQLVEQRGREINRDTQDLKNTKNELGLIDKEHSNNFFQSHMEYLPMYTIY